MKFVEVNNESYACKIHRNDEPHPSLLMLHGFMGDHRVFDHLMKDLCKSYNPIAIDLLGHGKSSKPTDPDRYNENKQVNNLIRIIKKLDLSSLFLFGYSMGGRLALKTALAAPKVFDGLILESTDCGIIDESKRKKRRQTDELRAQQIENDFPEFLKKWKELDLFESPLPVNHDLVCNYHKIQKEQKPEPMAASLRGFGTGSMKPACDELKKLDLPVLLLAGSKDEKYQRLNRFIVGQFSNAKFSSIPAGHRTHLDNPDSFIREITTFSKKISIKAN